MKKYLQILTIIIVIITLFSCEKIVQFPNHKEDNERYDFVENGVNLGKGIAIIGDWDGDRTTPATTHEFSVLCKNRTWLSAGTYACEANAYPGYEFFGEDEHKIPGTGVFFPASGYRRYHDGSAFRRGFDGLYWSSIPDPSYSRSAYYLNFSPSFLYSQSYGSRADCLSVRCVSE